MFHDRCINHKSDYFNLTLRFLFWCQCQTNIQTTNAKHPYAEEYFILLYFHSMNHYQSKLPNNHQRQYILFHGGINYILCNTYQNPSNLDNISNLTQILINEVRK